MWSSSTSNGSSVTNSLQSTPSASAVPLKERQWGEVEGEGGGEGEGEEGEREGEREGEGEGEGGGGDMEFWTCVSWGGIFLCELHIHAPA